MLIGSCTLGDLLTTIKQAIEQYGPEAEVATSSDYGDHCHTEQIHRLECTIEEKDVKTSGYSTSGFAVDDSKDDEDADPTSDAGTVLILS